MGKLYVTPYIDPKLLQRESNWAKTNRILCQTKASTQRYPNYQRILSSCYSNREKWTRRRGNEYKYLYTLCTLNYALCKYLYTFALTDSTPILTLCTSTHMFAQHPLFPSLSRLHQLVHYMHAHTHTHTHTHTHIHTEGA